MSSFDEKTHSSVNMRGLLWTRLLAVLHLIKLRYDRIHSRHFESKTWLSQDFFRYESIDLPYCTVLFVKPV